MRSPAVAETIRGVPTRSGSSLIIRAFPCSAGRLIGSDLKSGSRWSTLERLRALSTRYEQRRCQSIRAGWSDE